MGYWDATDQIIRNNGGECPICPVCGTKMYPIDDHGRFGCQCNSAGAVPRIFEIPQVPEGTKLSDKEKEGIPPINRLHLPPTEKEKKFFERMLDESNITFEP